MTDVTITIDPRLFEFVAQELVPDSPFSDPAQYLSVILNDHLWRVWQGAGKEVPLTPPRLPGERTDCDDDIPF